MFACWCLPADGGIQSSRGLCASADQPECGMGADMEGHSTVYSIIITVQCILIEYVKTQSNMGRIHFLEELEFCLETVSTSTSS